MSIKITVVDRKQTVLMNYVEPVANTLTVQEFKRMLVRDSDALSKCNLL
jgi:PHD/YefM family antitoxin component YafN of YafNO toxin-antitoxin module